MDHLDKAEWVLRVGTFGTFIGHGIYALLQEPSWFAYLTTVGFSESIIPTLLIVIGIFNIIVAIAGLVAPYRIFLVAGGLWALTASLVRTLSGEPVWAFLSGWAYFAAPLGLMAVRGCPRNFMDLLRK